MENLVKETNKKKRKKLPIVTSHIFTQNIFTIKIPTFIDFSLVFKRYKSWWQPYSKYISILHEKSKDQSIFFSNFFLSCFSFLSQRGTTDQRTWRQLYNQEYNMAAGPKFKMKRRRSSPLLKSQQLASFFLVSNIQP